MQEPFMAAVDHGSVDVYSFFAELIACLLQFLALYE